MHLSLSGIVTLELCSALNVARPGSKVDEAAS